MGTFCELTKFIPFFSDNNVGEWIYDKKNDGSKEHPKFFPYVRYSDSVLEFQTELNRFCRAHPEFQHVRYEETLEENGFGNGQRTLENADVSGLDGKCVLAMLICGMRAERFCEGAILSLFREGLIIRWLERLKEIDENVDSVIDTPRLKIRLANKDEMERIINEQTDAELRKAYSEMLQGCLDHPDRWIWYAVWIIKKKDGTIVGDLSFKGLNEDGSAEIGYGIDEAYRGNGYATEAVSAAVSWALDRPGVIRVDAETEPDNKASQRVLEKCGFSSTGTYGLEGPRFVIFKKETED